LAAQRAIAYTIVITICVRMAEKGLLHREKAKRGYGYVYTATIGEREFATRELAQVLDSLVRDYPSALVHYLDTRRAHAAN
jgi:predicted transcriptional regulator